MLLSRILKIDLMKIPTYKEIQSIIKNGHGVSVKTCWIADVKERHGMTRGPAPNRIHFEKRLNPCPEKYVKFIEALGVA